jgi:hypothetical protein
MDLEELWCTSFIILKKMNKKEYFCSINKNFMKYKFINIIYLLLIIYSSVSIAQTARINLDHFDEDIIRSQKITKAKAYAISEDTQDSVLNAILEFNEFGQILKYYDLDDSTLHLYEEYIYKNHSLKCKIKYHPKGGKTYSFYFSSEKDSLEILTRLNLDSIPKKRTTITYMNEYGKSEEIIYDYKPLLRYKTIYKEGKEIVSKTYRDDGTPWKIDTLIYYENGLIKENIIEESDEKIIFSYDTTGLLISKESLPSKDALERYKKKKEYYDSLANKGIYEIQILPKINSKKKIVKNYFTQIGDTLLLRQSIYGRNYNEYYFDQETEIPKWFQGIRLQKSAWSRKNKYLSDGILFYEYYAPKNFKRTEFNEFMLPERSYTYQKVLIYYYE